MKKTIEIYDTTLRDGTQAEEIAFTVDDKLRIIAKLDSLGVHYIEAGWPGSNPRDTELFVRAQKELSLKKSRLVAFGATRKAGIKAADSPVLKALLEAGTKTICIFGKTWDLHVHSALGVSLIENLEIISDSVKFLKKNGREVIFDAEHFFDGFKANKSYALKALKAAAKAGADRLVLCDTNGGTLPHEVAKIVAVVRRKIRGRALGIHCHNDSGVGVANSLAAVAAGATQVQGTINGIGERCGNANLCTIVANLELKMGYKCLGTQNISRLTEVALFVDELANRAGNPHQPYVGRSAFAHKGGVHVAAVVKDSRTYEHINPAHVGNHQRILLSDLSGAATIIKKAKEFGLELKAGNQRVQELLHQLKGLEGRGYQFEAAEASFELCIKKALGKYKPHFFLHDFKVTDSIHAENTMAPTAEAVIHLAVDGHEENARAVGVGPVHAIDQALRRALERFYPVVKEMKLMDYKVRVLPAGQGTASSVRVLIECGDASAKWVTVGVSENIIQASYQALVDSIDYKLMKDAK